MKTFSGGNSEPEIKSSMNRKNTQQFKKEVAVTFHPQTAF